MTPQELQVLYKKINNYDRHLNFDLKISKDGIVTYEVLIEDIHLSSPGTCHGGVIAGLMDNVLGVTALAQAVTEDKLCATVEFKVNYLNPALKGDRLYGEAVIDHKGQRIIVTSGTLRTKEKLIAKGIGTFNLYPASKKDFFSLES
jgi:uncharacterized protein (TIGR00369 family)